VGNHCVQASGPRRATLSAPSATETRGQAFAGVTVEPAAMDGLCPAFAGCGSPPTPVVAIVAGGMNPTDIVTELPDLNVEDIAGAILRYLSEV